MVDKKLNLNTLKQVKSYNNLVHNDFHILFDMENGSIKVIIEVSQMKMVSCEVVDLVNQAAIFGTWRKDGEFVYNCAHTALAMFVNESVEKMLGLRAMISKAQKFAELNRMTHRISVDQIVRTQIGK